MDKTKVTRYVDLSEYWPKESELTIQKAHEETGIDKRTLSTARKGFLDRAQIDTLFKLRELASKLAGKEMAIEDIVKER
jgi:hypothetical protein